MDLRSAAPPNPDNCTLENCPVNCASDVLDNLLRAKGKTRGDEVDALLDLRSVLRQRQDAEAALALFCRLRGMLETQHYLDFYRLRRWLENHIQAEVLFHRGTPGRTTNIILDADGLEAMRGRCRQSVIVPGEQLPAAKVRFRFRPQPKLPIQRAC